MATVALEIETVPWAVPLLEPARYKGAKGGRSRGASHFFAEAVVLHMLAHPDDRVVCVRETQRSLRFSAKSLIEAKIRTLGLQSHFKVLQTEIRRVGGTGICIFEGMQDHTADSIKSLEAFHIAWVEEAQSLSKRSLDYLVPTIRTPDSELWFSWNPDQPDDPVEVLFRGLAGEDYPETDGTAIGEGFVVIHATYQDNPFCTDEMVTEAERMRKLDLDAFAHIWLGEFDVKSEARIFTRVRVEDFDPELVGAMQGPYHGCDFGFANDPTTLVKCWIHDNRLYLERESYKLRLDVGEATVRQWRQDVPGFDRYVIRADSARPDSISLLAKSGAPKIEGAPKGKGSVEDGVEFIRKFDEIVIHERCRRAQDEARLYSYKVDKHTGDILPQIEDKHNHIWDAVRYALSPLIRPKARLQFI